MHYIFNGGNAVHAGAIYIQCGNAAFSYHLLLLLFFMREQIMHYIFNRVAAGSCGSNDIYIYTATESPRKAGGG
jgi:hypothetical protein